MRTMMNMPQEIQSQRRPALFQSLHFREDWDIRTLLENSFRTYADRLALLDGESGEGLTYGQAATAVERVAAGLHHEGVICGDTVLMPICTSLPAVICCWAVWRLGAIPVPVDASWPPYLLQPVLDQINPRCILHAEEASFDTARPSFSIADASGFSSGKFLEWLAKPAPCPEQVEGQGSITDPGVVLFTSGSTGLPKGVVLSRGALARSGSLAAATFGWQKESRFLNLGDLYSMSGLRNTCLAAAACGATAIIVKPSSHSDPFSLAHTISKLRPTVLGAGPMTIRMALQARNRLPSESWLDLSQVICTGAPLAAADARAFKAWTGRPVLNYYGLTETTGICISHNTESASACDGTIGWPVGAICRILNEADREMPAGESGELVVSGDNLMLGYLGRPDLTAEVLRDGRFFTGDRAKILADGRVEIIGRIRDCIKTARTDLLFPEEVDGAIASCADILDAAAICIRDAAEADRMVLFLVPRAGMHLGNRLVEIVRSHLSERLGRQRLPHAYQIVDHIPRLGNGKNDRNALEEYCR